MPEKKKHTKTAVFVNVDGKWELFDRSKKVIEPKWELTEQNNNNIGVEQNGNGRS